MEQVTVHFKLSEREWLDAYRWLMRRDAAWRSVAVLAALLILLPFLTFALSGDAVLPIGLALTCWPFLAAVPFVYYYTQSVVPRRYYRGDRRFRDGLTFTFAADHLTCRSRFFETRSDWNLYTGLHETEGMYVLVFGEGLNMITAIPKRAFSGSGDEQAFRSIVFPRFGKKLGGHNAREAATHEDDYSPPSLQPPDWR